MARTAEDGLKNYVWSLLVTMSQYEAVIDQLREENAALKAQVEKAPVEVA